jgi:DNA-binding winged helix-turn-helix (wHTH) protein/predicted Zn-dependent protease
MGARCSKWASEVFKKPLKISQYLLRLAMSVERKQFYEFGPFRIDPDKGLLLRDDQLIPLQPKAFETLLVLVQNSGTVVLKNDLMKTLWPDSFVEESNLTQHIFVLRKTLGETAGENRYIATIPGRGYRFAEKVRLVPEHEEIVVESHSVTRVVIDAESSLDPSRPSVVRPEMVRPTHKLRWVGLAAVALAAILAGAWHWRSRPAPKLTEKDTIVVADFENRTGDPVLDDTLKQALTVDLDQSPYLNVVSDRKISEALKLMGRDPGQRLTGEVARDLCQRLSSNAILQGSIANLGNQYVVVLTATNCATGDSLASEEASADSKEKILPAVDKAASSLRAKLGESLDSIEKYDTPVEQASTPSLAALQAYSAGINTWKSGGDGGDHSNEAAIPFYQRAIELDPNFVMAYAHLGQSYSNLGVENLAIENMNKAFKLRDRVSERERLYIDSRYYLVVTGEIEKAIRVLERWRRMYPREWSPAYTLAVEYRRVGRYQEALREARASVPLEPGVDSNYYILVLTDLALNRLDEAQAVVKEWQSHNPVSNARVYALYTLAFLRNDLAGMQNVSAQETSANFEGEFLSDQANTEAFYGRFRRARELTRRARALGGIKEDVSAWTIERQIDVVLSEAVAGYSEQARRDVSAFLNLSRNDEVQTYATLALALAGDTTRAHAIAAELAKRNPLSTLANQYWLPTIRAAILLNQNNPDKAVQELEVASRFELASPTVYWALLFPVYVRGQAFLALHQGGEAAAEFQKYIDHPGLVRECPLGALARVGLARAYAMQGDTVKARAEYQEFFSLWEDADPDVPVLKLAKAEYARLH